MADGRASNLHTVRKRASNHLWEEVLERHNWLNILGALMFLREETDEDPVSGKIKRKKTLMFPRYHQWRAVRKIITAIRAEGTGRRYLIEHSAGSGKTNTIAWTAHRAMTAQAVTWQRSSVPVAAGDRDGGRLQPGVDGRARGVGGGVDRDDVLRPGEPGA